MTIKFKARVLLELGAELISSDAVALYELIKNGIDAGSKRVDVEIHLAIQPSSLRRLIDGWSEAGRSWSAEDFLVDVEKHMEPTADAEVARDFLNSVGKPESLRDAIQSLREAAYEHNSITISDSGKGMNRKDLIDCYLTIGTPVRLLERQQVLTRQGPAAKGGLPLGEKGIGRLAAMRLGHHVTVYTGVAEENTWLGLTLDWGPVFENADLNADELNFEPTREAEKSPADHGTDIFIQELQADWSKEKLQGLWNTDLSKLADPFEDEFAFRFLRMTFQGESIKPTAPFDRELLKHADAYCKIVYRASSSDKTQPGPALQVSVEYRHLKAATTTTYSGAHLHSVVSGAPRRTGRAKAGDSTPGSNEVTAALPTLGDFDAEFYWFNRGRIMRDQFDTWSSLGPFVRAWSGGLLVYRDGYRVYPYGSATDDWLDLDRKALASSAFKLNRAQIIGRLEVSSAKNPRLKDQTNREGFRDCPEKEALRQLLRQAIIGDCRSFLESVEKQKRTLDPTTVTSLDKKIALSRSAATRSLLSIQKRVPEEREAVQEVLAQLSEVEDAWKRAKEALIQKGNQLQEYVHLAGVGLSVEFIAHELARSTERALELLSDRKVQSDAGKLDALRAQLKTINKRVRVLDELSIPGRQRKSPQDLVELVEVIIDVYSAKAERHRISVKKSVRGKPRTLRVERGQVLQILDNLMSNSMYWLTHRIDRVAMASVAIDIDHEAGSIMFSDTGPGVPVSLAQRVFEAFFTTKPPGDGRGLGLAIARQLATENEAELELLPAKEGRHQGFSLIFK